VLALVERLRDSGKTVLIVSHRLEDLIRSCDRIVVFRQGKTRPVMVNQGLQVSDLVHAMF
jgi:ABC-type sugar transport system ATPase subunit